MANSQNQLPDLAGAKWLESPALRSVFSLLGGSEEVRVVGGAVRDALLGETLGDIDLATVHSAHEIMCRAERAGIKAVATGGDHGTVSLIVMKSGKNYVYEVTPLRIDVETDGRHAMVAPTQSWALDAHRRDFYINALYCDEAGKVYDFVDGLGDILNRQVRFIGTASHRIEEDFLRILRFFRFSATYTNGVLDSTGLTACIDGKEGLSQLSGERVKQEMFKLLVAPFALEVIRPMVESRIMEKALPGAVDLECLANLIGIDGKLDQPTRALPRLAALAGVEAGQMEAWGRHLKLSNKEKAYLSNVGQHVSAFSVDHEESAQKNLLYSLGDEIFRQCAVLAWSLAGENEGVQAWKNLIALPERWQAPVFPLKGTDVLALGVSAGPRIGEILSQLEQSWIDAGFEWDASELAARLKATVQSK